MNIGTVLKDLRVKKGISQVAAAKKLKTTQTTISKIENNQAEPRKNLLKKMCTLYNTFPAFIVWASMEEKDVHKNKLDLYRKLKPSVDGLLAELSKTK